ncbi:MAG TPA: GNAT family N-acetyltransferase [Candidatus Paceibacterota bacterium]
MDRNIWQTLSDEMSRENDGDEVFLKERIAPDALRMAYEQKRAIVVRQGDVSAAQSERIIGIGVLWPTSDSTWFELGSLWVANEFRGPGLGLAHMIYRGRLDLLPPGAHGFVVTHNPRVVTLALKHGFREASRSEWPHAAPYAVVCGPCDRWETDEQKAHCPHRAVLAQCQLLVR